MSKALTGFVTLHRVLFTRGLVVILGCIAIWWGILVFPVFWQQSSAERIAKRIITGEPFKAKALSAQLSAAGSEKTMFCRPAALQSAAIIQLRVAEAAAGGAIKKDEGHLNLLDSAIRSSLSCAPADPFLWLVLFAVETAKNGYEPEYLRYLRMSYDLGPNEGWIVLRRNPVALASIERLPADLAESAIGEFARLIADTHYEEAAEIFKGAAWRARDAILPKLAFLPQRNREAFAEALYRRDLDASVPGVASPDSKRNH